MKIIDRIALVIFSIVILIASIFGLFVISGWIDQTTVYLVFTNMLADKNVCNILLGTYIFFILLAVKALFWSSSSKNEKYNDGIMLENDDGKLIITKETLIGLINGVVNAFDSIQTCQTRIFLDKENNLSIILNIEANQDTIIKEMINNLQVKIKEKLMESLDVEVKSLDVRVKNVVETKEKDLKD